MIKKIREKGFTLIELMIVIAVIALLILVLVPKIGSIKNKTREAGIRANLLMVEGIIQSIIDDYNADANGVDAIEARIAADINDVVVGEQKIKNPFTKNVGCGVEGTNTIDTVAVYYSTDDDADNGTALDPTFVGGNFPNILAGADGVICFGAYVDTSYTPHRLCVKLIPYGAGGKRLTALEKTITQ